MADVVEFTTERDRDLVGKRIVLRVICRPKGRRRWTRFLLVPLEGESYEDLEEKAELAAQAMLAEETAA